MHENTWAIIIIGCLLSLSFFIFTGYFKEVKNQEISVQTTLKVNSEYQLDGGTKGYPTMIDVNILGHTPNNSLYLHLFQKETMISVCYCQSSTPVLGGSISSLPVWLGGPKDINKNYEIYAVINDKPSYPKKHDVYSVDELPQKLMNKITVKRIK